jgi:hypothetical protein
VIRYGVLELVERQLGLAPVDIFEVTINFISPLNLPVDDTDNFIISEKSFKNKRRNVKCNARSVISLW